MAARVALVTTAIAATTLILYTRHLHQTLRDQVTHRTISPTERAAACACNTIESLPDDLLTNPGNYNIIHEQDCIPLPPPPSLLELPDTEAETLFTALMRRNMLFFSTYLPQSYLLRLLARTPLQKASFSAVHIRGLAFEEGDVACGFYRALVRRPLRCEMGMAAPAAGLPKSFGGRLITSVVAAEGGEGELLRTETMQWVRREEAMVLPLERGSVRWMHELACWWLLVSGAKWIREGVGGGERVRLVARV